MPAAIRNHHVAFVEAGGVAVFRLFGDVGGDGHGLRDKPDVWTATADDLRERGLLPNAGR